MDGSKDDEETPTGTGGFPAHSPLALFGHNGVTWGSQELVPSTDPVLVTGETLWACSRLWKPEPVLSADAAVEKMRYSPVTAAVRR